MLKLMLKGIRFLLIFMLTCGIIAGHLVLEENDALAAVGDGWLNAGDFTDGGVELALFVDDDIPYVAYTNGMNALGVKYFDGTIWRNLGPANITFGSTGYIDIDGTGLDNLYLLYAQTGMGFQVKKYNPSAEAWEDVGSLAEFGIGFGKADLFVFKNVPYVVYNNNDGNKLNVLRYNNQTNRWILLGNFTTRFNYPKLYVYDDNTEYGIPYLVYSTSYDDDIYVKRFDGVNWVDVGSMPVGKGDDPSLYVHKENGNAVPYVAFRSQNNKLNVLKFQGGQWQSLAPVPSEGSVTGKLYVHNGNPYVAYRDNITTSTTKTARFAVRRYNGGVWEPVGAEALAEFVVAIGEYSNAILSFTIHNGTPYVAYSTTNNTQFAVKKFAGVRVTYVGTGSESGNVPVDNKMYKDGETVTVPGNPGGLVKTGYTLAGWNTQADGNGTTYAENDTFFAGIHDVTLYAKWEANTYVVSFDAEGGTVSPSTQTKRYDSVYGKDADGEDEPLPVPVREGYTFLGGMTVQEARATR